jgi:hypothetical protein
MDAFGEETKRLISVGFPPSQIDLSLPKVIPLETKYDGYKNSASKGAFISQTKELEDNQIELFGDQPIGKGNFGQVWRASWKARYINMFSEE